MTSERNAQDDSEQIFDTDDSEVSTDTDLDTEDGEQDQDDLNLEEGEDNNSSAEQQREKIIAAYRRRLKAGEITAEDIPVDQKWVLKHINLQEPLKVNNEDVDAIIERKFAEKEKEKQFSDLKASLNQVATTPAQRKALQEEFKDLRDAGADKVKALEKAIKLAGIDIDSNPRLNQMRLPPDGVSRQPKPQEGSYPEMRANMTAEERVAHLEKLRKRQIHVAR